MLHFPRFFQAIEDALDDTGWVANEVSRARIKPYLVDAFSGFLNGLSKFNFQVEVYF